VILRKLHNRKYLKTWFFVSNESNLPFSKRSPKTTFPFLLHVLKAVSIWDEGNRRFSANVR
jgi:hypothetical protein